MIDNERIQLEAYRLIRIVAREYDGASDEILGAYTRGVVDLQTELYSINQQNKEVGK